MLMKKKLLPLVCLKKATRSFFLFLILWTTCIHGVELLVPSAMELIDDIDECLHETGLLFKGKHETNASTSSYFQNEFPQFLSVTNHHIEYTFQPFDGHVIEYEYPSSGSDEITYFPYHFAQKCRNIGGMTQTHDLSIKCKWKDNVEELKLDMPESPICLSRKCNASMLRKQLSIELARQVQYHLKQQIHSEIGACRVTSDACVRETERTQEHIAFGYRTGGNPSALTDLYSTLSSCNDINKDGYCFASTKNDAIECEQKGGQLIMHQLQISYTGDLDSTRGFRQSSNNQSFTVVNYPHCISRICEVGRDAEDIEDLFVKSLIRSTRIVTDNFIEFSKLNFSLKILNDDVKDYYNEPNSYDYSNDDETRSSHDRDATHRKGSTLKSALKTFLAVAVSTTLAVLVYLNINSIKAAFRRYHSPEVIPPSCEMA